MNFIIILIILYFTLHLQYCSVFPYFPEKTLLFPPPLPRGEIGFRSPPLAKGRVRVGFFNRTVLLTP